MKNLTTPHSYKHYLMSVLNNQSQSNQKHFLFICQILDHLQLNHYLVSKANSTNRNFAIYTNNKKNKKWIAKFQILSRKKKNMLTGKIKITLGCKEGSSSYKVSPLLFNFGHAFNQTLIINSNNYNGQQISFTYDLGSSVPIITSIL